MVGARLRAVGWTVAFAVFAAIAAWPPLTGALALERSRLAAEPWRLVTCHWTHWTVDHLCWNVAVFAALGAVLELRSRAHFLGCVVISALAISATLVLTQPDLVFYRGLSGIDSALFASVVVALLHEAVAARQWRTASWLALAITVLLAKIAFESVTGRLLFVDAATFTPLPLVHAIGAMVGVVMAPVPAPRRERARGERARAAAEAPARECDQFVPAAPASSTEGQAS